MNKEENIALKDIYYTFQGFLDGIDPIGASGGEDEKTILEIGKKFDALLKAKPSIGKEVHDLNECGICGCTAFHIYRSELTDDIHCNDCNAYCSFVESNIKKNWKKKVN